MKPSLFNCGGADSVMKPVVSQCIGVHMVNMKTALRLFSYSIPDVEILKTIKSILLNRGSDI